MVTAIRAYTLSECMDVMAEYAEAYEKQNGDGGNLIFCEDRLTLIAERALTRRTGGTFFSSVTTFARFLRTDKRILTKQGSVMAVGGIMTALQEEKKLRCFTSAAGIRNNARPIYETLAQLAASAITPETLTQSARLTEERTLKDKLADLAEIYDAYTRFLRENGYVDESGYLALLPARIRADGALKKANVFFLCYSSFTAQAAEAIRAAAETAANVVGIFCGGKEEIYTNRAFDVFVRACAEGREVSDGEGGAGVGKARGRGRTAVGENARRVRTLDLGVPLDGEAEVLRRGLFDAERLSGEKMRTDRIRVFEAEDKSDEAEHVAATVRRLLAETPGLRYRDVAVLVPDTAAYSLPFKKAFGEYGIPCFYDEKRSLKRHPLARFLLDCFAVVREGYSPSSVQALASDYFFGESDEYRNYLLKFANYRGGARREIKTGEPVEEFDREKLENGRNRLLKATEAIGRRGQGRDYCRAVRKILVDFDAADKLEKLTESVADPAYRGYLGQIPDALERVLAEAELLTGERAMTAAEFETVLADGLDATDISLIPMKADAVFLGSVADSRIEKVRVLFAAGLTDEVPGGADDTALISDREIERLAEVKTMLEPTVAEVNLRTRESVCLNLCAFTDRLYLSYPLSSDGSEPTLSEIFRYADGLFRDGKGMRLQADKGESEEDFRYRCGAVAPAVRELLIRKNAFENGRGDCRREYSSLYAALERLGAAGREDILGECRGALRVKGGEKLFFRDGQISPTLLESYFCCPFCNFASHGLRLREREETAVMAYDSGNFIHALLEKTTAVIGDFASEEEARAYAREKGRELLASPVYASMSDTAAGGYSAEMLLGEGCEVAAAVYRQLKNSSYRVEATEREVRTETFHGKADRVDASEKYVRVVDYKTGKIDDSATSYYTGRKLQLQLYMSAVKGTRIPAGVFYFPASVSYESSAEGRFRMKGFLNGDPEALLCGDNTLNESGGKSEYFDAGLSGTSASGKVMDEETFRDFLDYAVYEAEQGAKELREGFIAPSPYKGECRYCRYGGMCGFNYDLTPERNEPPVRPAEIARIVRKKRDGEEETDKEGRGDGDRSDGVGGKGGGI